MAALPRALPSGCPFCMQQLQVLLAALHHPPLGPPSLLLRLLLWLRRAFPYNVRPSGMQGLHLVAATFCGGGDECVEVLVCMWLIMGCGWSRLQLLWRCPALSRFALSMDHATQGCQPGSVQGICVGLWSLHSVQCTLGVLKAAFKAAAAAGACRVSKWRMQGLKPDCAGSPCCGGATIRLASPAPPGSWTIKGYNGVKLS